MSQNRAKYVIYKVILPFDHDINQQSHVFKFDIDQHSTQLATFTMWL